MGKFLVRITIILVSIFFIVSYILAQVYGIDILTNNYIILFELIAVVYCFSEGKYHCKYLKYMALGILLSDTLTRLDYYFDFLSVYAHNIIPLIILCLCFLISLIKALNHFFKVIKLKHKRQ